MTEIISKDMVQERIDNYIKENTDEIIALIDKKIEVKVKEAIREVFSYQSRWEKTPASKVIDNRIAAEITIQAESVEIDKDWIQQQVEKKVKTTVKNLRVVID